MITAVRRYLERGAESVEAGFTLTEVLASMAILTIFLAMFTGAVIQLFGASTKANAVEDSSSQINSAFLRLDREVRYAAAIDAPTQANGGWYVEFYAQNTGVQICTQLRVANGTLAQRSWAPAPTTAPVWDVLASSISNPTNLLPFVFYPSDTAHLAQRLEVKLQSTSGSNSSLTNSTSDTSFTALNSSPATATNVAGTSICADQGRP